MATIRSGVTVHAAGKTKTVQFQICCCMNGRILLKLYYSNPTKKKL